MPLYLYRCEAGHETERLVKGRNEDAIWCACGQSAQRQSVYTVGISGFSRAPIDQRQIKIGAYKEASAELEYKHSRQTNVDGSERPTPPLWQTAKREAKRLMNLGVKDSLDVRS